MQVKYLPMPISFEEKREWNKKGFKVVDELYAPASDEPVEEDTPSKQKPKKPPM